MLFSYSALVPVIEGVSTVQDIGVGFEPKARPCKPSQLLLADEKQSSFLFRLVIVITGLDNDMKIILW